MRLDRFDLNLLVALDALLEERSVTRAGLRLHIGQSAASAALARLREYFADQLLVPVGRGLQPTPLAASLAGPVRDALLRARAAIARRPAFDPAGAQRRFMVYASDYVTTVMLAQAARRVAALAPGIAVDIRSPPRDVLELLERGGMDLLLLPEQYLAGVKHPQQPWFEDDQVCMVWRDNQLAGRTLTFARYLSLGHVAVRFGDDRNIVFEDWFLPRHGKQRRIEASVDNFSTLPLLLIGTNRIATLHRRLAEYFAAYQPVRLLKAPFKMPPLVEVMCWPRHLDHDPAHRWFRETLLAQTGGGAAADLTQPPVMVRKRVARKRSAA